MTTSGDEVMAAMAAVISEVTNGNLRARATVPEDAPTSAQALAEGINALILGWRNSELQARKMKRELEAKLVTIERAARVTIRELSTPIMQVWKGVLLLPLVGSFDEERSRDVSNELLQRLATTRSTHVIIDITGVEVVDTQTADSLVRLARSAKLLGADCIVTGVSPAVAQTLTALGTDLTELETRRTLAQGLVACIGTSPQERRRV